MDRNRIALGIEILIFAGTLAGLIYFGFQGLKHGDAQSLVVFLWITLLTWWPMLRDRIRTGVWR
jgi:hypothetical protein